MVTEQIVNLIIVYNHGLIDGETFTKNLRKLQNQFLGVQRKPGRRKERTKNEF